MLQPGDGKRHRGRQKVSPATRFAFFWTFFATRGESSMPQVSSLQNLNMKGANNIKRLLIYYVSESWRVQQEIVFWHSWITFWCGFCFHVATVCNWVNHEANLWPRGWGWQWPGITPMNYTCIHVQFGSQICLLQHVCFPLFVEQGAFGTNVSKFCWWSPIWILVRGLSPNVIVSCDVQWNSSKHWSSLQRQNSGYNLAILGVWVLCAKLSTATEQSMNRLRSKFCQVASSHWKSW